MQVTVNPRFDQRFICKLAIGVAYCLFGPKVLDSVYSKELYKGLWYRKDNEGPDVRGSTLFSPKGDPNFNSLVGFPNAVTLVLLLSQDGVAINLNINSQLNWTVLCASNENLTAEDVAKIHDGQVLLLVRALQAGIYLDLPSYLAYRSGITLNSELDTILERSERNKR